MTRRVFFVVAGLLLSCQVASGQTYGPQPGGPAPQTRTAPQQPQPPQRGSAYAPPQQAGAYAVRPAGGQQPAGPQPVGPQSAGSQPAGVQPVAQPGAAVGQGGRAPIPAGRAPQNLPPAQVAPAPQPPPWAQQMTPEQAAWLDQFLGFWETRSNKVKTFECKFQCWKYDTFAPPGVPHVYTEGSVKYAQPDKGLYRVEKLSTYQPPPANPPHAVQDPTLGEHWVCDGKQIFQFDAPARKVVVLPLPVEMQGKAIADGPLPFMFGAKSETIKARYWVRGLQGDPGKYLLEAVPKSRQDAQNFKKVIIQLDEKTYLPDMLQVFEPNSDEKNQYRKTYKFVDQKTTDDKMTLADFAKFFDVFRREFYEPRIPQGWKKEVQSDLVQVMNPPVSGRPPQEAQRPASSPKSLSPIPR